MKVGSRRLEKEEEEEAGTFSEKKASILRQLGDIEMALSEQCLLYGEGGEQAAAALRSYQYYYRAFLELSKTEEGGDKDNNQRALDILTCDVMTKLSHAACVYEYNYSCDPNAFPGFPVISSGSEEEDPVFVTKIIDWKVRYGMKDALDITIRLLGKRHPLTLRALSKEAFISYSYDTNECLQLYQKVVTEMESVLGKDHAETIDARTQLAATHCTIGQFQQGFQVFGDAMEPALRVFGADHTVSVQLFALMWRWMEPRISWILNEYPTIIRNYKELLKAAKEPTSTDNSYWYLLDFVKDVTDE